MARALFFGEISNFLDFVEPMCSGIERARIAVDACKSNKDLLAQVLGRYTAHARVSIRSETAVLDQRLIDSLIPAHAPILDPGKVTAAKAERAMRMIQRIDALADDLVREASAARGL